MLGHIQYIQCTVTCRVRFPQHTNNSVVCTDTRGHAHTHTRANSSSYAWEEKRERKEETEVKDRATARVCGCETSTAQVIRQPVSSGFVCCGPKVYLFIQNFLCNRSKKSERKKKALLFHSLGTTKILLLKQISVKK